MPRTSLFDKIALMKDKKTAITIIIISLAFLIAAVIVYFLFIKEPGEQIPETGGISEQELLIQEQLQEIDRIRQKEDVQPISQETPDKQIEELNILRQENQESQESQENYSQPLSQEEITAQQIEELDNLRSQSQ